MSPEGRDQSCGLLLLSQAGLELAPEEHSSTFVK